MKYMVCWRDTLIDGCNDCTFEFKHNNSNFYLYCGENSKEMAVKQFLERKYDDYTKSGDSYPIEYIICHDLAKAIVDCAIYGDYEHIKPYVFCNQNTDNILDVIYDMYKQYLISTNNCRCIDGDTEIIHETRETEKYKEVIAEKLKEKILSIINPKKYRDMWIYCNMLDVAVIELSDL